MQNNYTSVSSLPNITYLTKQKKSLINNLINNLKINDVKDDSTFLKTSERIKKNILIEPVKFDPPQYIDHEYIQRNLTMEQQVLGMKRDQYIFTISFPFEGNIDLFSHAPSTFSFSSSDHGVIMPDSNSSVIVYASMSSINKVEAITEANNLFSLTRRLVEGNNTEVTNWNNSVTAMIDNELLSKRKELIENFG